MKKNYPQASLPPDTPPLLLVIVDTEEEFDWAKPHSRDETRVSTVRYQDRAHKVFDRYGLRPTYVIDYPVASQPEGFEPLRALHQDGRCQIGAHLHPWVNPPHVEEVTARNSYPGNLPAELEEEKLKVLTATIEENFGLRPHIYKAGRYGIGPNSAEILARNGYRIDTSIVPTWDYRADGGPDFRGLDHNPFWLGTSKSVLTLPVTAGFAGALSTDGQLLYDRLSGPTGLACHLPGIFSRLGLVERIRLTPEAVSFRENRRLTRALLARGCRVFSYTYHSPSLAPGHTPYVDCEADLARFIGDIDRYVDFFTGEAGGRPSTPDEVLSLVS